MSGSIHRGEGLADALRGIRVIDLTAMVAGPMATMMLADLGADVIKVERAGHGDDARRLPPFWPTDGDEPDDGAVFVSLNRNKRSVQLDLKRPAALAAVRRLIDGADVFIESFRPGKVDALGLSYEDAAPDQSRPRLLLDLRVRPRAARTRPPGL